MLRRHNVAAAQDQRTRMTPAEDRLWAALRTGKANGLKIRRQHTVGTYVLDFALPSIRLGIELDRAVHDGRQEDDAARTEVLKAEGYRVRRFPSQRVFEDLEGVIPEIVEAART